MQRARNIPKASDTLTNVTGLYALTQDGELGVFGEGNRFTVDHESTQAFGPEIRQLLKSYLENPDDSGTRLGVVYHSRTNKSWRSDTLVLEDHVLREVYPVSGPATQELTAFQKKNRVKSIYRGIELLIEYRYDRLADSPVYCPLLYDRDRFLDEYRLYLNVASEPGESMPVLEVLNLIPMIPLGRRNMPALLALMQNMYQYAVHKDMRRHDVFTIRQEQHVAPKNDDSAAGEFFDTDKRHEREQPPMPADIDRRLAQAVQVQRSERFDQVEQWLERPHRPVDPPLLRGLQQFRNLDDARLAVLAKLALVHTAPSGVRLLNAGMTDSWNMYLLEGTVSLLAEDGGSLTVSGGTDKAASPVSFLKPRKYTVVSVTSVSFLWVHDALLRVVAASPDADTQTAFARKPSRS